MRDSVSVFVEFERRGRYMRRTWKKDWIDRRRMKFWMNSQQIVFFLKNETSAHLILIEINESHNDGLIFVCG